MSTLAYIYELNDVIVDTDKYRHDGWNWLALELGFNLSDKHYSKIRILPQREAIDKLLKWSAQRISEADKQNFLAELNKRYISQIDQMSAQEINAGFNTFNNQLRSSNIKTGVISKGTNSIRIIDRLDLVLNFDAIVDAGMVTNLNYIELLQLSCEKMQLDADQCTFVSASIEGLQAAKSLGINPIGFGRSFSPNGSHGIIENWEIAGSSLLNAH